MGLVPDKILSDQDISNFVDKSNENADKIVSDSKFSIPTPSLPGAGLLIKLYIRQIEKSLGTYLSPIAAFKEIISNANPVDLIKNLISKLKDVKSLFADPIQAILDFTINKDIREESPFPIKFLHEPGNATLSESSTEIKKMLDDRLLDIVNSANSDFSGSGNSANSGYSYTFLFNSGEEPKNGQLSLNGNSIKDSTSITVSSETDDGIYTYEYFNSLTEGERISLSYENETFPFKVLKNYSFDNKIIKINISRFDDGSLDTIGDPRNGKDSIINMVYSKKISGTGKSGTVTGPYSMDPSSPKFNPSLRGLRKYIINDPVGGYMIKIPLSDILKGFPLADRISMLLGDFSTLAPENPTRIFIDGLEKKTGMKISDVVAAVLSGRAPELDFYKIVENEADPLKNLKEKSKVDVMEISKLIEISVTDPLFFITIILNYIKLLLLPISFFVEVLKMIITKIANPAKIIQTVIKVISNPIKFFCDLVTEAILKSLSPYLSRPLANYGISFNEALSGGIQNLVSDIVCGKFIKKFESYTPNETNLRSIEGSLPDSPLIFGNPDSSDEITELSAQFPYEIIYGSSNPMSGQIVLEKPENSRFNTIRVNRIDSTEGSSLGYMASVNSGDKIKLSINFKDYVFLSNSSIYDEDYYTFNVSLFSSPAISDGTEGTGLEKIKISDIGVIDPLPESERLRRDIETVDSNIDMLTSMLEKNPANSDLLRNNLKSLEFIKDSLTSKKLLGSLSVGNPGKMFLFLSENYLSPKMIVAWESIKGLLGVFLGAMISMPSMIPSIVKSIFSSISGDNFSTVGSNLSISTSMLSSLIVKFGIQGNGILALMDSDNPKSTAAGNGEPRKTILSVVEEMLFDKDAENRIESSLMALEEEIPDSSYNLTVGGIAMEYSEFVKRLKLKIFLYYEMSKIMRFSRLPINSFNYLNFRFSVYEASIYYDLEETRRKAELDSKIKFYRLRVREELTYFGRASLFYTGVDRFTNPSYNTEASINNASFNDRLSNSIIQLVNSAYIDLTNATLPPTYSYSVRSALSSVRTDVIYAISESMDSVRSLINGVFLNLLNNRSQDSLLFDIQEISGDVERLEVLISKSISDIREVVNNIKRYYFRKITGSSIRRLIHHLESILVNLEDILEKTNLDNFSFAAILPRAVSLSDYTSQLEYFEELRYEIRPYIKNYRIFRSVDDRYNYFDDPPVPTGREFLYFDEKINGNILELYYASTISDSEESLQRLDGKGIILYKLRELILSDIRKGGKIIGTIV